MEQVGGGHIRQQGIRLCLGSGASTDCLPKGQSDHIVPYKVTNDLMSYCTFEI